MRVTAALRPTGIRNYAIRAYIVTSPHDGDERGNSVLVDTDRLDVAVSLLAGKLDIDLRLAGSNPGKKQRQRPVRVRTGDKIHAPALQELVLQALGHAADDTGNHALVQTFLSIKLVNAAPYTLLGIVPDGTGIGHYHVSLVHIFRAVISSLFQDGKNNLGVIDIHLAPVSLYIYFLVSHLGPPLDVTALISKTACKDMTFINFSLFL